MKKFSILTTTVVIRAKVTTAIITPLIAAILSVVLDLVFVLILTVDCNNGFLVYFAILYILFQTKVGLDS